MHRSELHDSTLVTRHAPHQHHLRSRCRSCPRRSLIAVPTVPAHAAASAGLLRRALHQHHVITAHTPAARLTSNLSELGARARLARLQHLRCASTPSCAIRAMISVATSIALPFRRAQPPPGTARHSPRRRSVHAQHSTAPHLLCSPAVPLGGRVRCDVRAGNGKPQQRARPQRARLQRRAHRPSTESV